MGSMSDPSLCSTIFCRRCSFWNKLLLLCLGIGTIFSPPSILFFLENSGMMRNVKLCWYRYTLLSFGSHCTPQALLLISENLISELWDDKPIYGWGEVAEFHLVFSLSNLSDLNLQHNYNVKNNVRYLCHRWWFDNKCFDHSKLARCLLTQPVLSIFQIWTWFWKKPPSGDDLWILSPTLAI